MQQYAYTCLSICSSHLFKLFKFLCQLPVCKKGESNISIYIASQSSNPKQFLHLTSSAVEKKDLVIIYFLIVISKSMVAETVTEKQAFSTEFYGTLP